MLRIFCLGFLVLQTGLCTYDFYYITLVWYGRQCSARMVMRKTLSGLGWKGQLIPLKWPEKIICCPSFIFNFPLTLKISLSFNCMQFLFGQLRLRGFLKLRKCCRENPAWSFRLKCANSDFEIWCLQMHGISYWIIIHLHNPIKPLVTYPRFANAHLR